MLNKKSYSSVFKWLAFEDLEDINIKSVFITDMQFGLFLKSGITIFNTGAQEITSARNNLCCFPKANST